MKDSPCVARCTTLYDDVCRGCGRTAWEVANWVCLTEPEKEIVWKRIGKSRKDGMADNQGACECETTENPL